MINLLPLQYKERLLNEKQFKLLVISIVSLLFFFVALGLLFAAGQIYLQGKIQSQGLLLDSLQAEIEQRTAVQEEIKTLNATLRSVGSFYTKEEPPISFILDRLANHLPQEGHLGIFEYAPSQLIVEKGGSKRENAKISLTGFVPNTDTLFHFRENLQKDPLFENVYFPPENWVLPVDITFSMTVNINPKVLPQDSSEKDGR